MDLRRLKLIIHVTLLPSTFMGIANRVSSSSSHAHRIFRGGAQRAAKDAAKRLNNKKIDPRRALNPTALHALTQETERCRVEQAEGMPKLNTHI